MKAEVEVKAKAKKEEKKCRSTSIDAENAKGLLKDSRMWEREANCSHALTVGRKNLKESFQVSVLQKALKVRKPPPVDPVLRSSREVNRPSVVHR